MSFFLYGEASAEMQLWNFQLTSKLIIRKFLKAHRLEIIFLKVALQTEGVRSSVTDLFKAINGVILNRKSAFHFLKLDDSNELHDYPRTPKWRCPVQLWKHCLPSPCDHNHSHACHEEERVEGSSNSNTMRPNRNPTQYSHPTKSPRITES